MPNPPTHRLGELAQNTEAILSNSGPAPAAAPVPSGLARPRLITLRPEQITQRSALQTRPAFDPEHDPEDRQFAESVQKYGVTQPVVVYPLDPADPQAGYGLVAGHRRLDAARYTGLAGLPALLVSPETTPERRDLLTALENLQRKDLQPVEKARQIERLMATYGYDQKGVAAVIGLSRTQVHDLLALLAAPDEIRQAVAAGTVGVRNAREMVRLPEAARRQVLDLAEGGLPVRAAIEQVTTARPDPEEWPDEPEEFETGDAGPAELARPDRWVSPLKAAAAAAGPVERLLGEQADLFQAALAERPLADRLPKGHLPLLAVIWLASDQDLDQALATYNRQTQAFKGALEKIFAGFDRLAILRVHAARPEDLAQAAELVEAARQAWLGE